MSTEGVTCAEVIARFTFMFSVSDDKNSSLQEIKERYVEAITSRVSETFTADEITERQRFERRNQLDFPLFTFTARQVQLSAHSQNVTVFVANYFEGPGTDAYECVFTIFLCTSEAISKLEDAIRKIRADLHKLFQVPEFLVKVSCVGHIPKSIGTISTMMNWLPQVSVAVAFIACFTAIVFFNTGSYAKNGPQVIVLSAKNEAGLWKVLQEEDSARLRALRDTTTAR